MSTRLYKQTGIRLPENLIAEAKRKAKKKGLSFNSYVESVIQKDIDEDIPYIDPDVEIDADILSLASSFELPSKETIKKDPRLQEILQES